MQLLIASVILVVLGFVVGMTFNYFGASGEDMENVISLFPITLCSIMILGFNVFYLRKKIYFKRQFHTEDIYHQIKKKLDTEYKGVHLKIEDNKNLLSFHYQKDKWYKSMLEISEVFTKNKSFSFQQKKDLLTHFIQSITLSYQNDKKVHELTLFLKIPLIYEGVKRTVSKNVQKKNLRKPLKKLTDQPNTRSFYSTVTDLAKLRG